MLPSAHLTASGSGLYVFPAPFPPPPILCLRFTASLTVAAQDSRPSGSLLLSRKALSSSTFMPVYPGAPKSPLRSSASARQLGSAPFVDFLKDRCGSIVDCLRTGGLRTLHKVYDEIKTWGY